ncbi:MAG: tyrosine-type recombinase/integrase, partial [Hyphomicrobiaceae bacterium]
MQYAKPKGDRAEFRIKGAKNLVLRVTAGGARTWTFLYASPSSGRRCKLSLGTYPAKSLAEAKDEALVLAVAVKGGSDPLVARRAGEAAETFASLANQYIAEHRQRNARGGKPSRATAEIDRLLRADILPVIGHHRAEAVTKRQVMETVEAVAARGSFVTADHVLGLVRAIYNWANSTGRLEVNPTFGLKKRNAGKPRERVLSDIEVRTLWQALDAAPKLSDEIRTALKLELLLGVRIGEALGAARSEVDLELGVWTIPAHRTKAEREHRLPLSPLAVELLRTALDRAGDSPWLFPSPIDGQPIRPKSASRVLLRVRDKIGVPGIGTHDLRRTLATGLGNMGVADEVIERVLNHAPRTVAGKHYNHAKHFEPMRHALEAW